jgi:hypothetical protein
MPAPAQRSRAPRDGLSRLVLLDLLFPCLAYGTSFILLTYPLIRSFSMGFFCESGDGLQNEWNLWWVRKAIVELHASPWHTTWLHAPGGVTLIGHTLNPINGLIGIPLSLLLSPTQVYNTIVIACFVLSGLKAYWLALHLIDSELVSAISRRAAALLGGFAFTFTGFHFAHAQGHMQLISTEFIPLFLLLWLKLLEDLQPITGLAAGLALGLVALCDLNFVFYCALAGAVSLCLWFARLVRLAQEKGRRVLVAAGCFIFAAASICGPLVMGLLIANRRDPMYGAHEADAFSADLFAPFVPGAAQALGRFTRGYWSTLTGGANEQSIYLGTTVVILAAIGAIQDRRARWWIALAVTCYVLSLGPMLHVGGAALTGPIMPFALLSRLIPPLQLSGCPVRISVMFALAASMLAAMGAAWLLRQPGRWPIALLIVCAVSMPIELWPSPLPVTPNSVPPWTVALRRLPIPGAVISTEGEFGVALYYQTLFDRPMAYGYISRVPMSVDAEDRRIAALGRSGDFAALRAMGFAYAITPAGRRLATLPLVHSDRDVNIWQIAAGD